MCELLRTFVVMNVQQITNLEHAELRPYRTLRRPLEHFSEGIFVGEGEKVFDRMLERRITIVSALLTPDWLSTKLRALEPAAPDATVFVAEHSVLESIVGFHLHQGIMALGRVPPLPSVASLLDAAQSPPTLLALDGLANAENVGVIVRNAVAFGVSGLIVGETSSSPFLRRAVRNSMGAIFSLPVAHTNDLVDTLQRMKSERSIRIVALETSPNSSPLHTFDLTGDVCLVVGSEGKGIRKDVLSVCEACGEIPMQPGVDSLNVANATAVALYEVQRQRNSR